jgi:hypothetical protein
MVLRWTLRQADAGRPHEEDDSADDSTRMNHLWRPTLVGLRDEMQESPEDFFTLKPIPPTKTGLGTSNVRVFLNVTSMMAGQKYGL